jgi:DNA-3-methyladenine glycosylase
MEKGAQVKRNLQKERKSKPSRAPAISRSLRAGRDAGSHAGRFGALFPRAFFEAPPERVAPCLLGKVLVHKSAAGILAGRIVEVEAYLGPHNNPPDPAAHSHRGPTPRNRVLFGPPGHAYVYSIYGRYFCMNVTCEIEGKAGGVLLRALEPVGTADLAQMAVNRGLAPGARACDLTAGPSRLCQALGLTRLEHNALDLLDPASPLQLRDDGFQTGNVLVTPRIGIKQAVDWPLRFALPDHPCVSGPKSWPRLALLEMNKASVGKRVFIR